MSDWRKKECATCLLYEDDEACPPDQGHQLINGHCVDKVEEPECPAGVEYDDDPACCDCSEDKCPNEPDTAGDDYKPTGVPNHVEVP